MLDETEDLDAGALVSTGRVEGDGVLEHCRVNVLKS